MLPRLKDSSRPSCPQSSQLFQVEELIHKVHILQKSRMQGKSHTQRWSMARNPKKVAIHLHVGGTTAHSSQPENSKTRPAGRQGEQVLTCTWWGPSRDCSSCNRKEVREEGIQQELERACTSCCLRLSRSLCVCLAVALEAEEHINMLVWCLTTLGCRKSAKFLLSSPCEKRHRLHCYPVAAAGRRIKPAKEYSMMG